MTTDKYRRNNSHCITVRSCLRTHLTLFILGLCRSVHTSFVNGVPLKTNQLFCTWLTFILKGQSYVKSVWRNLNVSQYFRPVVKMGPKLRKTLVTATSAVLISHFRGLLIIIFRTIKCNEEYQVINWPCTEIQYWNWYFY